MTENTSASRTSRRAEYAEVTRRAIIDAARRLFSEGGYFATKVDQIAVAARVSPATVYGVAGGKAGLLGTLIDEWCDAPVIAQTRGRIEQLDDPMEIVRAVSTVTHEMRRDYRDIIRVLLTTAPHDATAAAGLETATKRYRAHLGAAAKRLADLDALRADVDAAQALDILWFYFGYSGFVTLTDDNRWSFTHAEQWLFAEASHALLCKSLLPRVPAQARERPPSTHT